jgi:hypothetical protein
MYKTLKYLTMDMLVHDAHLLHKCSQTAFLTPFLSEFRPSNVIAHIMFLSFALLKSFGFVVLDLITLISWAT